MKGTKLFTFILVFALAVVVFPGITKAEEEVTASSLTATEASAEFEADEITAESLGIEEPKVLPGDRFYWWDNFKDNAKLFFTFNAVKKVELNFKFANKKILQAKMLAEKAGENADKYLEKALEVYDKKMTKIGEKLEDIPEDKKIKFKNVLDRLNNSGLKHEQVLRNLKEKLPFLVSAQDREEKIEKLETIRKQTIQRWYDVDKENIKDRLIKAAENNSIGSKLKHLKNLASIEEFKEILPEDAVEHIEEAGEKIREKLSKKLETLKESDKEKFDKYIHDIKLGDIKKYSLINDLDNEAVPKIMGDRIKVLKKSSLKEIERNFKGLNNVKKEEFLKRFEKDGNTSKMEILERLEIKAPVDIKERIRSVNDKQKELIKERIQRIDDPEMIKILTPKLESRPILLQELKERDNNLRNMEQIQLKQKMRQTDIKRSDTVK